jgi:hypothetical protein
LTTIDTRISGDRSADALNRSFQLSSVSRKGAHSEHDVSIDSSLDSSLNSSKKSNVEPKSCRDTAVPADVQPLYPANIDDRSRGPREVKKEKMRSSCRRVVAYQGEVVELNKLLHPSRARLTEVVKKKQRLPRPSRNASVGNHRNEAEATAAEL